MAALAIALTAPTAHADTDASSRAAYVQSLVRAFAETPAPGRDAVVDAVRRGARTTCRSSYGKPGVRCMLKVARDHCPARDTACLAIADVTVTNLMAEDEWIDTSTRVKIMNASDDYREAMDRELARRFAPIAAEMSLRPGFAAGDQLGASIDGFCVGYSAKRRLAWQRCVAAMVWYAATSGRTNP